MRVLVVDPDVERRDLVELWVTFSGHATAGASTTKAALEALASRHHDLAVVIDSSAPGLTALEAIRAIRARWPDPRRPALVVFAMDLDRMSWAELVDAGASEVIAGPPRVGVLRQILARCGGSV